MWTWTMMAAALAAALLTTPAQSETSRLRGICFGQNLELAWRMKACTAIINSPTTSPADRADAHNERATFTCWRTMENDEERAVADLMQAVKLSPPGSNVRHLRLGWLLTRRGDYEGAIAAYEGAMAADPVLEEQAA